MLKLFPSWRRWWRTPSFISSTDERGGGVVANRHRKAQNFRAHNGRSVSDTKHKRLCVLRLGAMAEGFRKRFGETVTGETKNAATLNAKNRAVMFLIGNNISGGAIWWSQTSP
ncbi:hypothetical protein Bca52824_090552 [Brassica carinata]|uniref:Uncharacterized protein n=1 Tax=Brassica carinata TaxID=52824 RepID=A0A8X7NY67_BRACI|nr:hypothetical protein Bca52824_090552 [Brassica carinata]